MIPSLAQEQTVDEVGENEETETVFNSFLFQG